MPNANYVRGANFERAVVHDLQARGYYSLRSAGSHSKIDVFAVKGDICLFIQCKLDGKLPKAEREVLVGLCECENFLPLLACRVGRKLTYYLLPSKAVFDPGQSEKLVVDLEHGDVHDIPRRDDSLEPDD